MLIKCPECDLNVTDKAVACPHCGYPMAPNTTTTRRKTNKRRRLPNGFGQITELKGRNLRKPFRAMITVAKDKHGKPICKPLQPHAYFETYNDAYRALIEYNRDPYDITINITAKELYEKWLNDYMINRVSASRLKAIRAAWRYCSKIYNVNIREIRPSHIRFCMEQGTVEYKDTIKTPSKYVQPTIKSIFTGMLDYAVLYGMADENCAKIIGTRIIKGETQDYRPHIAFTEEEINTLWKNIDMPYVDIILIQCYSGWRPSELLNIRIENVNLEEGIMIGGMKTNNGKNRIVPIHFKIYDLVRKRYEHAKKHNYSYLLGTDSNLTYSGYTYRFDNIVKNLKLNPEHRPHDGRVHFITMAKKYRLDEYAIKYIVGHSISDLTEKVYTKRDPKWLYEEINKIEAVV